MSESHPRVALHEVAPRDGLQNEKVLLTTETKLELVRRLAAARPASIEVGAFVRPDFVPQMADTPQLCAALAEQEWVAEAQAAGVRFVGLVPNRRGYERLRETFLQEVTLLASATDQHSQANVGKTVAEALAESSALIGEAQQDGLFTRLYVSMAFRSRDAGRTDPQQVMDLTRALLEAGAGRVMLSDTLGIAEQSDVIELLEGVLAFADPQRIGLHMHDTYGRAVDHCQLAFERGIRDFDAATGGTGGCPFAPGAKGNLASEDLLQALPHWPARSETSLAALLDTAQWLQQELAQAEPLPVTK